MSHKFEDIHTVDVSGEQYTMYRMVEENSGRINYRLALEPTYHGYCDGLILDDGCDVEEIPHDIACQLLGKLFGVFVYHSETFKDMAHN